MKPLALPILVLALALGGCGSGAGSTGATGTHPGRVTAGNPRIDKLGVSEPTGAPRSCPREGRRVQREIARLQRLARTPKPGRVVDEITVSCASQWTPGDGAQGPRSRR